MIDNELEDRKSMRRSLTAKYIIDGLTASVVYAAIIILGWFKLIDQCTTGTLMGAVIGFHLRGMRKLHK